jgi:hypothetical protein
MDYTTLIGSYGFPVAMCLWFMFRTEKALQSLREAIVSLTTLISNNAKK